MRSTARRATLVAAAIAGAIALVGCANDAQDFQSVPQAREAGDPRVAGSNPPAGLIPDQLSMYVVQQLRDRVSRAAWPRTDFSRHLVPLNDFLPGGPLRDGIPPLDHPRVVPIASGNRYLRDDEPVLALALAGEARAYPLQIMLWHEIANDALAHRPIAVTYCPLCNSGVAFDRRVDGRVLRFGTTGLLRRSDLVMWDRQTQSWWQQLDGRALVGRLAGKRLRMLPLETLSWADFKRRYPHGDVLARATGFDRAYGQTPYRNYDSSSAPRGFNGRIDGRLPPMERVLAVRAGRATLAAPYSLLRRRPVLNIDLAGNPILILYQPRVLSALDARRLTESRDVGTAIAYDRRVGRGSLSFEQRGGRVVDRETGSAWDVTGRAISGPMRGRVLRPLLQNSQFWFALAALAPAVRIVGGQR